MERQYQPQPITVPKRLEASSGRQLKQIVDNRPEFATQAKMLGQLGVVQRVCPITAHHRQTGGNCGLFCIKMAIETITSGGKIPTPADYDKAAEGAGSHIGEIFDIPTMEKIIVSKELGTYKATSHNFRDAAELKTMLAATGLNPTLIGFANDIYLARRGVSDAKPVLPSGQRGHWSLIQNFDNTNNELEIVNPNSPSTVEKISLSDMNDASQAISLAKGQKFDWKTFAKDYVTDPLKSGKLKIGTNTNKITKAVDSSKSYTSTINGTDVDVTNTGSSPKKTIIIGGEQNISIGGSLVTIT